MKLDIKKLIKDKTARFAYYTDGNLWYEIVGEGFKFPIPIDDTKGAFFNHEHKAINLMRWIRKHIELIDSGETVEQCSQC